MPIPIFNFGPNETYDSIRDDLYDLSGAHGEGAIYYRGINADATVTERIWKEIREKLELDEEKICSQLWGFLDEWGKNVLEIALYRIPMPLHIKGALGVILITFAVVEAAKNVKEKRKRAIDDFMDENHCSEDVARLEVDKKVNGWIAEEVGKGIIAAALEHFLKEKGLSELTRNFITSAWSSFISSAEFNAWQDRMKETPL